MGSSHYEPRWRFVFCCFLFTTWKRIKLISNSRLEIGNEIKMDGYATPSTGSEWTKITSDDLQKCTKVYEKMRFTFQTACLQNFRTSSVWQLMPNDQPRFWWTLVITGLSAKKGLITGECDGEICQKCRETRRHSGRQRIDRDVQFFLKSRKWRWLWKRQKNAIQRERLQTLFSSSIIAWKLRKQTGLIQF